MGIPVIVIKGIFESGKSYFIKDSLIRGDFGDLGKVLILSQEEGLEEFDEEFLSTYNASFEYLDKDEWEGKAINDVVRKHKPQVIFLECNEMWGEDVYFPNYFDVQQVITVIDGSSFNTYFQSMRQLFFDMIKESELVIINRCEVSPETSKIKKAIKVMNSGLEIIALDKNGNQIRLASDLPYDVSGEEINIKLNEFGDFYVDSFESPDRYQNKVVKFECMALFDDSLPPRTFVAGRGALTCCVDDIQTIGHLCSYTDKDKIKNQSWILLTARVHYMDFHGETRILLEYINSIELPMPAPEQQLVNMK